MSAAFADQLRVTVAMLQAEYSERADEVARAYAILRSGMLVPDEDGHGALVQSSTDPDQWYTVNGVCACPAGEHGKPCKHRSAWKFYQHVQRQLESVTPTSDPEPTPAGIDPALSTLWADSSLPPHTPRSASASCVMDFSPSPSAPALGGSLGTDHTAHA